MLIEVITHPFYSSLCFFVDFSRSNSIPLLLSEYIVNNLKFSLRYLSGNNELKVEVLGGPVVQHPCSYPDYPLVRLQYRLFVGASCVADFKYQLVHAITLLAKWTATDWRRNFVYFHCHAEYLWLSSDLICFFEKLETHHVIILAHVVDRENLYFSNLDAVQIHHECLHLSMRFLGRFLLVAQYEVEQVVAVHLFKPNDLQRFQASPLFQPQIKLFTRWILEVQRALLKRWVYQVCSPNAEKLGEDDGNCERPLAFLGWHVLFLLLVNIFNIDCWCFLLNLGV